MPLPELDLLFELDQLFRDFFATGRRSRYGVEVTDAEPGLSVIYVEFRFLAGRSYCCGEPMCHLPQKLARLVQLAAERSIRLPDDVLIRWHCVVEEGARLQCHSGLGIPLESEGYEIEAESGGRSAMNESKAKSQKPAADFTGLWTNDNGGGARVDMEYMGGLPNGIYRSISIEGVCLREGFMKNGQRHGKLITRNSDGTVLDISEFHDGTGVFRIFNAKGQLADEIPLRHGIEHGVAKRWCFGELVELRHYVDGECVAVNFEG